MKKKIFVTGGLGFIGSNLVKYLISKKYFIIIIDNFSYASNKKNLLELDAKNFKIYNVDINNKNKIYKLLIKYNPEAIFNLAAETHVDRSIDNPKIFIKSNVNGVFNLLETIRNYNRNDKMKLIHISTDEVYGDIPKKFKSKEKDRYNPSSPYSATKAASDLLIKAYVRTYGLNCVITNCCNNYGPNQVPEKFIPKIIFNILKKKNIPVYGDGKQEREWIYVDDHCEALFKIFKSKKTIDQINIGSGDIITNLDLLKKILKIFKNKNLKGKLEFVKDRPGHDLRYALDSNKLKKLINWKKKYSLDKGLIKTIDWYLKNFDWINMNNKKNILKRMGLLDD